jgi:hypothetical protein
MDHLVNQRVDRLTPSVATDVPAADHDLSALARRIAVCVVAEPALHPARYAYGNLRKQYSEPLAVERLMSAAKSLRHRLVIGVSSLRNGTVVWSWRLSAMDRVGEQLAPGSDSRGARFRLNEHHDRPPGLFRCVEKPSVNANFVFRMTDKHRSVRREAAAITRIEPERHKSRAKLGRVSWTCLEFQRELRFVARPLVSASAKAETEKKS